jgi:hypothetical protein
MESIVVTAILELLSDATAYLYAQVVAQGQVSIIEQQVQICPQK